MHDKFTLFAYHSLIINKGDYDEKNKFKKSFSCRHDCFNICNRPRLYDNRNYRTFMTDRYYNEPVYVYHGRYYYGGKYKHGRYYFKGYRLSGGRYYHYPRIHHKHRFENNDPRMYENYKNNDRINEHNQDTRSYNDDREYRKYDQNR